MGFSRPENKVSSTQCTNPPEDVKPGILLLEVYTCLTHVGHMLETCLAHVGHVNIRNNAPQTIRSNPILITAKSRCKLLSNN